ncbi:hypothetical protein JVT61DRAFT_7429 [Boletus reticuloceps]|uniref:Uncharacterized protein n=1 Tax=Boletus reticuloceps TaxID=495285 RepID=A0A8I2YHZ2_9AGAM|nr:hypothetical protein JVT61DRAFT_7429 [Boletus reticuloceps]
MKEGMYHHLAPILFVDPNQMTPNGFLKSPVLVNVLRLLISGRNALTKEKARGGPRARGQIHGIKSVTEGLITLAAIFINPSLKVRYLLTPDPELQSVGSETKIPYEVDYDFYLQCLLKQSTWAIRTIHFFNMEVFSSKADKNLSAGPAQPPAPTRTWEDDFLDNLDNVDVQMSSVAPEANANATLEQSGASISSASHLLSGSPVHDLPSPPARDLPSPPPARNSPSPLLVHALADPLQATASNSMISIDNHSGATLSSVSRLQVEVGQLRISGMSSEPRNETSSVIALTVSGRRVSSVRHAPIPIHLPETSAPSGGSEPLVQKRTTRSRAKAKK